MIFLLFAVGFNFIIANYYEILSNKVLFNRKLILLSTFHCLHICSCNQYSNITGGRENITLSEI